MADRKISDLTALTTPAAGDYLPIIDISEPLAANKNKRITIEELLRGAPDGTAGAPGIGFESDSNTGIYSPGADALGLVTAGTERLRITSAGLVGIGTSSPSDTLQINKTGAGGVKVVSTTQSTIAFSNATGTGGYIIGRSIGSDDAHNLFSYDATNSHYVDYFAGGSGGYRSFYTNGSERLRITSAGLVGIGASLPSVRLQVQDSIAGGSDGTVATLHNFSDTGGDTRYVGLNFRIGSDNGTSAIRAYRTNSASNYETNLSFWTNPAGATQTPLQAMTIDSYQRVGIGTTSPGATLHLNGGGGKIRFGTHPNFYSEISHDTSVNANTIYNNNDSAGHQFMRNGTTELARIDSSGRLGLGTSSPSDRLHIREAVAAGISMQASGTGGSTWRILSTDNNASLGGGYFGLNNGSYRVVVSPTGNVGIGTTGPISPLTISDSSGTALSIVTADTNYSGIDIGTNGSSYAFIEATKGGTGSYWPLSIWTGGQRRVDVDTSGRLLVGTSSQSGGSLLQVNDNRIRIATAKTPASATDTGVAGEICWDANYVYVCTATNTWKRTAISTW